MNGSRALCDAYARTDWPTLEVAVFPPAPFLAEAVPTLRRAGIAVGAQNVDWRACGALTGEISAGMVREVGVKYALAGHSERRSLFGETSAQVAAKCEAILSTGLTPVLCVGDTAPERDAGRAEKAVAEQLQFVLDKAGEKVFGEGLIAYEPVWAIGVGRAATPGLANDMHGLIRAWIGRATSIDRQSVKIIYGGSVNSDNAKELIREPDIDGFLVGGASLDVQEFARICRIVRPS